jgi:hypothetical protein
MESVLGDVKRYFDDGGRDLVILLFSHYWNRRRDTGFTDDEMRLLLKQVTQGPLKALLYDRQAPAPSGHMNKRLCTPSGGAPAPWGRSERDAAAPVLTPDGVSATVGRPPLGAAAACPLRHPRGSQC